VSAFPLSNFLEGLQTMSELPKLTAKQQKFVTCYALYGNGVKAYRMAYDCSSMSDDTIKTEAHRLLKNKKVAQWIAALEKNKNDVVKKEFEYSVQDAFSELNDLQSRCKTSYKTYNVEKSCIDSKCKLAGLFNDEKDNSSGSTVTIMGNISLNNENLDFKVGEEVASTSQNT
jgi:hypothetical protein